MSASVFAQGLARPSGLRRVRSVKLFPVSGPGLRSGGEEDRAGQGPPVGPAAGERGLGPRRVRKRRRVSLRLPPGERVRPCRASDPFTSLPEAGVRRGEGLSFSPSFPRPTVPPPVVWGLPLFGGGTGRRRRWWWWGSPA